MSLLTRLLRDVRVTRRSPAPTLRELFSRWERINKWRHYLDIYERYLGPLRGTPIRLLEIGVFKGGSLRLWREYFGPQAELFGVELSPDAAALAREGFGIFIGDQGDPGFMEQVKNEVGTLDVVIDDGGHSMRQQVNSFEVLYPATSRVYIVEDTHTSYWPRYQDRPEGSFIDYAREKIDLLHEWHWNPDSLTLHNIPPERRPETPQVSEFCATTRAIHFYDSMVVFEKGENEPRWHERR